MLGNKKKTVNHHYDTLVSNNTRIEGDVHFTGGLHIDGTVVGSVIADEESGALVRISDQGVVQGQVRAPLVIINGQVNGDVFSSEHVELAANACVTGTVHYQLIEMVMGAQVNGSLVHEPKPETQTTKKGRSAKTEDGNPEE